MNAAAVANPEELVTAVFVPPEKLPEAPLPGAVNVTITPLTGFPLLSCTNATSGLANAVPTGALCGVPPLAEIDAAALEPLLTVKL